MSTEMEEESFGKVLLVLIAVALVVGGGLYGWQKYQASIVPYQEGVIVDEENCYMNDFFKIKFECPKGYSMNHQQTSAMDMKNITGKDFHNTEEILDSGLYYQELNVTAGESYSGMKINVVKSKLDLYNSRYLSQIEQMLQENFSSMGDVSISVGKPYDDKLADQTYQVVDVNFDVEGYPMKATMFVRNEGRYSVLIVVSEINESTNDLIEGFKPYK